MTEATVWPTFTPHRACQLCDHGRDGKCARPEVLAEFDAARRQHGACGPEARFLTIKGFDYSKEIA
jgi:hypothetical protein